MTFELPKLDYEYSALEPYIDARTMEIHHTKHHQAYIDKLNSALKEYGDFDELIVEELLKEDLEIIPEVIKTVVRNNGGGHFNHSFFWKILAKDKPISENFKKIIEDNFFSFEEFKKKFLETSLARFGSGWSWLVKNSEGKLEIYSTPNQDSPIMKGDIPLIGLDLWEHAYYLNYQNKRADYVNAFFEIINWEKVEEHYNL